MGLHPHSKQNVLVTHAHPVNALAVHVGVRCQIKQDRQFLWTLFKVSLRTEFRFELNEFAKMKAVLCEDAKLGPDLRFGEEYRSTGWPDVNL